MRGSIQRWIAGGVVLAALAGCNAAPNAASTTASTVAAATGSGASSAAAQQSASSLPACANAGAPIALPAAFPAAFPLPSGGVVTQQEQRSGDRTIISGVAPGDVQALAEFWETALPNAGFKQTGGESEPGEAEANFEGNGLRGRWKINSVPDCPQTVTFSVLVGK